MTALHSFKTNTGIYLSVVEEFLSISSMESSISNVEEEIS